MPLARLRVTPVLLEELLYKPAHSLIDQSLHSRLGAETTNGDGFGVGCTERPVRPGLFKSIEPAWNDRNLRELPGHIRSGLVFAHIRASSGTPIQQTNCHPFRHGRWLWMHNGAIAGFHDMKRELMLAIDPSLYSDARGLDRLRDVFLPCAHARARGRPARGSRARRRAHRGRWTPQRDRASNPDDGRNERRRDPVGVPVLERGEVALALLQLEGRHSPRAIPGQPGTPRALRRDKARGFRAAW